MLPYAVEFAVALLLAFGAIGLRAWRKRISHSRSTPDELKTSSKIQIVMNQLQFDAGSHRVAFVQARNGGSILQSSEPWASTVLYEVCSEELGPKSDSWIAQPIDGAQRHLLQQAFETPCHIFKASELPRSILKSLYDADGVQTGVIAVVSHNPGRIFYLALNYVRPLEESEVATVEESVRMAVVRLKQLLKVK